MRLVKKPTETLSLEQSKMLFELVLTAEKRDKLYFDQCEKCRAWLKGDQWDGPNKIRMKDPINRTTAQITVNLAHAHVRSMVPMLFFRQPTVRAWPLSKLKEASAQSWGDLINAWLARSDYKVETKAVVLDAVVYPEAWKKWVVHKEDSYTTEEGEDEVKDLNQVAGGLTEIEDSGPNFWDDKFTIVGTRMCPTSVITDSADRRIENSRFIAIKYRRLLSELIADPRYIDGRKALKEKMREAVPEQPTTTAAVLGTFANDVDELTVLAKDTPMLDIYEVWVYQHVGLKLYKQVVVLAEGIDEPIRGPVAWSELCGPHLNTYPFNKIELNPIPDDHPQSELAVWFSLQSTLNWVFSKIVAGVNNSNQVYAVNPAGFVNWKKARNELESSKPRQFVEIKGDVATPPLVPIPQHAVPRDDWQLISVVQMLIQQVTGMTQNRRGATGARTATEADIIEQSAQDKNNEKIDAVREFLKRDIELLTKLIRGFVSKDIVFRLTGTPGPVKWGQFTPQDASWSPDVEVETDSFRRAVSAERVAAYNQMLQVGLALQQSGQAQIRLDIIMRRMMEELEIPNPQEITNDDVPAEVKQMAEIIQMVVGVPGTVLPTDNHVIELQTVEMFQASDIYPMLPPQAQQLIDQHAEEHRMAIQQMQAMATPGSSDNEFDQGIVQNGNPASEARQATADSRSTF